MTSNKILEAIEFAKRAHDGQLRKHNGRPYVTHPLDCMMFYALHFTAEERDMIVLALHDILEDCKAVTEQMIKDTFGYDVLEDVKWLTNPSKQHPDEPRDIKKKMDRMHIADAPVRLHKLKGTDRIINLQDFLRDNPIGDESPQMIVYAEESRLLGAVLKPNIPSWMYLKLMDLCHRLAAKHTTYRPS